MLATSRVTPNERSAPSLLATLKVRVSRLEAALRDKEAEVARLQASTKATTINELKIQAHTYYQEVVRLRNQLNISQHATIPIIHTSNVDSSNSRTRLNGSTTENLNGKFAVNRLLHKRSQLANNKFNAMDERSEDEASQPSVTVEPQKPADEGQLENTMKESVMLLHQENNALREQLTTLINTLQNSDQTPPTTGNSHVLEKVLEKLENGSTDASSFLQMRMSELQAKEVEWERERSSLRELISTLQEDRSYYKETATKKESEMEALQNEIISLQKEMAIIRNLETRKSSLSARTTPKVTPRSSVRPGSGSSSDGGTRSPSTCIAARSQSTVRRTQQSVTPRVTSKRSDTKASSEPREASTVSSVQSNIMSKSTTSSSSNARSHRTSTSTSARQQQLATSKRLASTSRTSSVAPHSGGSASEQRSSDDKRGTPRSTGSSTGKRSASIAPNRTPTHTATSSSSNRSSANSSAASSKNSSQKPTPVTSPTKRRPTLNADNNKTSLSSSSSSRSRPTQGNKTAIALTSNEKRSAGSRTLSSSEQSSLNHSSRHSSTQSSPSKHSATGVGGGRGPKKTGGSVLRSKESSQSSTHRPNGSTVLTKSSVSSNVVAPECHTPTDDVSVKDAVNGAVSDSRRSSAASDSRQSSAASESRQSSAVSKECSSEAVTSSPQNTKIVESLDELKNLLCSHLMRQKKLNNLLDQEPQLLSQPTPAQGQSRRFRRVGASPRHRRSPEGAEECDASSETTPSSAGPSSPLKHPSRQAPSSSIPKPPLRGGHPSSSSKYPPSLRKRSSPSKQSNATPENSPGLVRQGTFNLDQSEAFIDKSCMGDAGEGDSLGEGGWQVTDEREMLGATISAHLARVKQLNK